MQGEVTPSRAVMMWQATEPKRATVADLRQYRRLEADVYQSLAAELQAVGHEIDAGQLAWVVDEALGRLAAAVR
jgi:hypothetical protein